jgi:hypothetical protein
MQPVMSTFTTTVQQEQSNNWTTIHCKSLCMHDCLVTAFLVVRPARENRRCCKVPSCALGLPVSCRPVEKRNVWTRPYLVFATLRITYPFFLKLDTASDRHMPQSVCSYTFGSAHCICYNLCVFAQRITQVRSVHLNFWWKYRWKRYGCLAHCCVLLHGKFFFKYGSFLAFSDDQASSYGVCGEPRGT